MAYDPASLDLETYTTFIYFWGVMAVVSSVGLHALKQLPISSRVENQGVCFLGSCDKKLGWMIMETPILLTVTYFYAVGGNSSSASLAIVCAFVCHYVHRALIYPQRIQVKGKTMPVFSVVSCMIFYVINGFLIGHYFGALSSYPIDWLQDPRFASGATLFVGGFVLNVVSDSTLINLRRPGETGYKVPKGGMFEYVTCANYFAECVEWTGFAIMSWSLPGVVYALWVNLPLVVQSRTVHRWYLQKFKEEYPKERRAIIPWLL